MWGAVTRAPVGRGILEFKSGRAFPPSSELPEHVPS